MTYIIYKDGEEINRIEADEEFTRQYCEDNKYTWELPPPPDPIPAPQEEPTESSNLQAKLTKLYTEGQLSEQEYLNLLTNI